MGGVIPGFAASGQTLYAQISSGADGTIGNGAAFVAYNQANWGQYAVAMVEQPASGRYILTIPGYVPAGRYFASIFLQLGGAPAVGDTPMDVVFFDWDGGNILGDGSGMNVIKINGSATAAANLSASAQQYVTGVAAAGTLTTAQMTTNLTSAIASVYTGRVLLFTSGANLGRAALITAYAVTGGKLTFVSYNNLPINAAPAPGDTFIIV